MESTRYESSLIDVSVDIQVKPLRKTGQSAPGPFKKSLNIKKSRKNRVIYSKPNFIFKAASTCLGTSSEILPPYFATSFTMLELRNEY